MSLSLKRIIKNLLLIIAITTVTSVSAQEDFLYSNYDWDSTLDDFKIPDSLIKEPQIFFKKHQVIEFGFEDEKFKQIEVLHEIFWVNSDEAIDRNNKVYLPMGKGIEVISTKARVLNPSGKFTLLNQDDVKEITDENENTAFYYALKGIEKGSFIEYFYVIKKAPSYRGDREIAQELSPVYNYRFDLISPNYLIFETKSYNGFGKLDKITDNKEYQHLNKKISYIKKFVKEDQAYNLPHRMAILYKLDENTNTETTNFVTYKDVGRTFYSEYGGGKKKESKPFKTMLSEAQIDNSWSKEQKIRRLEKYFKTNYSIFQSNAPDLSDLSYIHKNKISNSYGFMKFMAMACNKYKVKFHFVMTSNRKNIAFDKRFEGYNFLQKYLMYFSEFNKYMDMEEKFSVLGLVDYDYLDNHGVFFNEIEISNVISATSRVKFLNAPDAEASHSDIDMYIKVADDFSTLNFDVTTSGTGYNVSYTQPYFGLNPEGDTELTEELIKWVDQDMIIHDVTASNTGYEYYGEAPLIISGNFSIDKYIVSIRDKYMIKLGLCIGPQVEMYQTGKKRTMPVDMGFRKNYHRVIKFEIPEGYNVTNLEGLNMSVLAKEKDGTVYADFISSYTLDMNVVTVICDERYHKIHYPPNQYEDYRKVINAAADFNKITIYLEPK